MTAKSPRSAALLTLAAPTALDAVTDGVALVDTSRHVVWLNRSACEMLGASASEAVGKPFGDLFTARGSTVRTTHDAATVERRRRAAAILVVASHHAIATSDGEVIGGFEIFHRLEDERATGEPRRARTLVAESSRMRALLASIDQLASTSAPILITGERGAGKRTVALAIHAACGRREDAFWDFDCSIQSAADLERSLRELEPASGATLFFRHVERLSRRAQTRLGARIAPNGAEQHERGGWRVVAATSGDIEAAVEEGRFDRDLFFALNVAPLHVPPLRERSADLAPLLDAMLDAVNTHPRPLPISRVDPEVLDVLASYDFPENVRELEQIVEAAAARCRGKMLRLRHLPSALVAAWVTSGVESEAEAAAEEGSVERLEREFLRRVLVENGWRLADAARQLELSRTTLWRKMKRFGIDKPRRS
jgi:DNA-binding NtrC family response regulator